MPQHMGMSTHNKFSIHYLYLTLPSIMFQKYFFMALLINPNKGIFLDLNASTTIYYYSLIWWVSVIGQPVGLSYSS